MSDSFHGGGLEQGRSFRTTHWSVVMAARHAPTAESVAALEVLAKTYWMPLYAFIRRRGADPSEAQDLTQGFFARLLEKEWLLAADAERGRFRTFLLTALTRFLSDEYDRATALKRGGVRRWYRWTSAWRKSGCRWSRRMDGRRSRRLTVPGPRPCWRRCCRDFRRSLMTEDGGRRWLIPGGRRVNDACFSRDGALVVWADEDGTLGMAEAPTGRVLWRTRPGFAIRRVWLSPDGRHVAWANDGFEFCVGDAADGRPYFRPVNHRRLVLDGDFSPDGREGLFVWLDGLVSREPLDGDGVRAGAELLPNNARHDAWLSADGRRLLTVDQDFRVKLQDPGTGEVLGGPWQIGPMTLDSVWTRDGERLVVLEGEVPVVRELSVDRRVPIPSAPSTAGNSVRVSPDGKRVLLVAPDLTIHVVNLSDGTPVRAPFRMPRGLWALEWAPDSRRFGCVVEGQVELWDAESGAPTGVKVRLPEPEGRVLFSGTGDVMVVFTDHFLGAIDLGTGKLRFPWKRHAESVVSVAIRPDGQQAATGTADGHAWVWDLNTGEAACPPFLHSGYVMSVAFSPDGTRLLTGDNGGTVCLWDVSPSGWSVERLAERVRRWRGEW